MTRQDLQVAESPQKLRQIVEQRLKHGELIGVVGGSGSGKTRLVLANLPEPDRTVFLAGNLNSEGLSVTFDSLGIQPWTHAYGWDQTPKLTGAALVEWAAKQCPGLRVVVFDPVFAFVKPAALHSDESALRSIAAIQDACREADVTGVFLLYPRTRIDRFAAQWYSGLDSYLRLDYLDLNTRRLRIVDQGSVDVAKIDLRFDERGRLQPVANPSVTGGGATRGHDR